MGEPRWITKAKSYLGLKEGVGAADNKDVLKFYALSGHSEIKHDSVPWCAAFVGGVLASVDIKGTGTLWALDYAKFGLKLTKPLVGAIFTKKRAGGGHVGFVVGYDKDFIYSLGGNQGDSVCIQRYHRTEVFSYRWPSGEPLPENPPSVVLPSQTIPGKDIKQGLSEA